MARIDGIDTEEGVRYVGVKEDRELHCTAIVKKAECLTMKKQLQLECNRLQDALDTYNAITKIEFDTPLK